MQQIQQLENEIALVKTKIAQLETSGSYYDLCYAEGELKGLQKALKLLTNK